MHNVYIGIDIVSCFVTVLQSEPKKMKIHQLRIDKSSPKLPFFLPIRLFDFNFLPMSNVCPIILYLETPHENHLLFSTLD